MKNFNTLFALIFTILVLAFDNVTAQRTTGINNSNPSTKAALHIKNDGSFKQGIIIPKLSGADTTTLKSPSLTAAEKGLIFYDTTNSVYQYWNGSRWYSLGGNASSTGNYWQTNGNTLVGADTASSGYKYIGTNNDFPLIFATKGVQRMRISRAGNVGIGKTPADGIPLQVRSNGTGTILQLDQETSPFSPLFEFKQTPTQNARFQMYDLDGNPSIELNAESGVASYIRSGNVGIGTATPRASLDISAKTDAIVLPKGLDGGRPVAPSLTSGMMRFNTTSNTFEGYNGTAWSSFQTGVSANPWTQSGANIFPTTLTNNVGIGTNSPAVNLHITNATTITDAAMINVTSGTSGVAAINFGDPTLNYMGSIRYNNTSDNFDFWTNNTAGRLIIRNNGDVGIGTLVGVGPALVQADASGYLSRYTGSVVAGNGFTNKIAYWNSTSSVGYNTNFHWENSSERLGIGWAAPNATLHLHVATAASVYEVFTNTTTEILTTDGFWIGVNAAGNAELLQKEAFPMTFATSNIERMRITPLGDIGIGAPTPLAKLHVNNGAVLFDGTSGATPTSGGGTRFMWIPTKSAIRAGQALNDNWDDANIGIASASFNSNNIASGSNSTSIGQANEASGGRSFAGGVGSIASGNGSTALGEYAHSGGRGEFSVGAYPLDGGALGTFGVVFEVGNGTGSTARNNALTVLYSGNVGIGTATPQSNLHINSTPFLNTIISSSNVGGTWISLNNSSTGGQWFSIINTGSGNSEGVGKLMFTRNSSAGSTSGNLITMVHASGNVGIGCTAPTAKLHVDGTIRASSIINTAALTCSDIRYKSNVKPIFGSLDLVQKLSGKTYYWKTKEFPDWKFSEGIQYGFIAQEIEKVLPSFVATDSTNDHFKSVDYSRLTVVLVEAVKEQQQIIDSLKNSNYQQDLQLQQLKGAIEDNKKQKDELKGVETELEQLRYELYQLKRMSFGEAKKE